MKRQRCVTSTPGESISTRKALIFGRSGGESAMRAITMMTPALTPLVHQSFSPLMTYPPVAGIEGRARFHLRRIGPDVRFGEGEGRNLALRATREEPSLLFLRAEDEERLRHPDGLVGGEQGGEVAAMGTKQHRGARVVRLRKTKPAVFPRDLDPEGAEFRQTADDPVGDLARAVDLIGIDLVFQKGLEPREKGVALVLVLDRLRREGRIVSKRGRPMNSDPPKLPPGPAWTRASSASSSAARSAAVIFEVSMTEVGLLGVWVFMGWEAVKG